MSDYDYNQHGGAEEEVRMILVSVDANSNKYWNATLCNDGTIVVANGRVGATGEIRPVTGKGEAALAKAIKSKEKKGYVKQRVVAGSVPAAGGRATVHENRAELAARAKREILKPKTDPYLMDIIEYMVQENIHSITSSTSIKFDVITGVFSTPLGILTPDAITDAKNLLEQIHAGMCKNNIDKKLVNAYLQIVPQQVGRKLNIEDIFGNSAKINQQMKTLESLEESIKLLEKQKADKAKDAGEEVEAESNIFPVKMDLEKDKKELKWINDFYDRTKDKRHSNSHMTIKTIFKIELSNSKEAFEKLGIPIGNVQRYWHGTSTANLLSILQNGLKTSPPNTARIAGKAFGHGIYFSDIATKSLGYATGAWGNSGNKRRAFMLVNDVAMGKSYDPSKSSHYGAWPIKGTDSTFAKGGDRFLNNEMIVYQNYQVNPTHLVEFTG